MWEAELRECLPQGPSPGLDLDRRVTLAGTPVESLDGLHRPAWGVEGGVSGGGTAGMQLEFTSVGAGEDWGVSSGNEARFQKGEDGGGRIGVLSGEIGKPLRKLRQSGDLGQQWQSGSVSGGLRIQLPAR